MSNSVSGLASKRAQSATIHLDLGVWGTVYECACTCSCVHEWTCLFNCLCMYSRLHGHPYYSMKKQLALRITERKKGREERREGGRKANMKRGWLRENCETFRAWSSFLCPCPRFCMDVFDTRVLLPISPYFHWNILPLFIHSLTDPHIRTAWTFYLRLLLTHLIHSNLNVPGDWGGGRWPWHCTSPACVT